MTVAGWEKLGHPRIRWTFGMKKESRAACHLGWSTAETERIHPGPSSDGMEGALERSQLSRAPFNDSLPEQEEENRHPGLEAANRQRR